MLQKKTKTTISEKTTTKNYIQFFLVVIIVALIYSTRPFTFKYGLVEPGLVISSKLANTAKGGGKYNEILFVHNDRIYETSSSMNKMVVGDIYKIYFFESSLWLGNDLAGEKITHDIGFLVYANEISNNVKQIHLTTDYGFSKFIDVRAVKNFGCLIKDGTMLTVDVMLFSGKQKTYKIDLLNSPKPHKQLFLKNL